MRHPADMQLAFQRVEAAVSGGTHAVAIIPYEAASAFDRALAVHTAAGNGSLDCLAWFGLYAERHEITPGETARDEGRFTLGGWESHLDSHSHADAVRVIRDYLGAGDVYQVNMTFPMAADFEGDPAALYHMMCRRQGNAGFCAYADFGDRAILSASPELFFSLDGEGRVRTRPMKGTRRRGLWSVQDEVMREALRASEKDRSENLMIVDLLRNDLGRVSEPGSVKVESLWDVERYDTVWQMTSTITARARRDAGLHDLFCALFPCGSVTGAPKVRATQVIREMEPVPRGAYTGCIGFVSPSTARGDRRLSGMEATFNVAIRTVIVERETGTATAGVGGGITWDSEPAAEYAECLDKAQFLRGSSSQNLASDPEFDLFETLLFEPESGYYLVQRHLLRMAGSARYFGFVCDEEVWRHRLDSVATRLEQTSRVRLSLSADGSVRVAAADMSPAPAAMSAVLAAHPIDTEDVFLYHKTTRRAVYESALAGRGTDEVDPPDEVILYNDRGELTECTIGNIVLEVAGRRLTPPVGSGLPPGTFREELLESGQIEEAIVHQDDLAGADAVYMINSLRRWVRLDPGHAKIEANESMEERESCTG